MTIGEFTIINTYFGLLLEAIKYYLNIGKTYQSAKVSLQRMMELESEKEEQNGEQNLENIHTISAKNIKFRYNEEDKNIFNKGK